MTFYLSYLVIYEFEVIKTLRSVELTDLCNHAFNPASKLRKLSTSDKIIQAGGQTQEQLITQVQKILVFVNL